jgi:ABC-type Na+ transport system ATPase subunit NatA
MTTISSRPAIAATGLRKSFGDQLALDGIDLEVPEGTILALLGPNGAGKTTIVHILSTLIGADGGEARVGGHDVARDPDAVRAAIGVTGQLTAVDNLLTGEENLLLMADLRHLGRREGRRRAAELLERFDLTAAARKPAATYSGGMRRRLDLAMGLIGDPRIIFLDEPTTGLDPRSRRTMWQIIRELVADGVTNTHIAERVGVTRPTVIACRRRYVHRGLDGLSDRPRPGRPQTVRRARRAQILSATLNPPPPRLGITHWSTRLLARELDVRRDIVARIWREHGVQPWRVGTFKFSTDPELAAKVHDVVGLYLHPPDRAVVLCVDEKSQLRALERTQPVRRVWPGRPEQRTTTTPDMAPPPCSLRWRSRPAGSSTNARRATATRNFWGSSSRSPAPTHAANCMRSATTTPPTSTPRSAPGSPATPASGCTSPQPQRRG